MSINRDIRNYHLLIRTININVYFFNLFIIGSIAYVLLQASRSSMKYLPRWMTRYIVHFTNLDQGPRNVLPIELLRSDTETVSWKCRDMQSP